MLRIILFALLAWFLYNLVFRFIIPIVITTRRMKKKFREMHDRMQDQVNQQQSFGSRAGQSPEPEQKVTKKSSEDYIDFEEIKER